jgi:hypothetical protein
MLYSFVGTTTLFSIMTTVNKMAVRSTQSRPLTTTLMRYPEGYKTELNVIMQGSFFWCQTTRVPYLPTFPNILLPQCLIFSTLKMKRFLRNIATYPSRCTAPCSKIHFFFLCHHRDNFKTKK